LACPDGWGEMKILKKIHFLLAISIIVIIAAVIYENAFPKVQESITFFPIDPKVTFNKAETSLTKLDKRTIKWGVESKLDRKAYLRQDIGLLFSNGRLIERLGEWKLNTDKLRQEKSVNVQNNSLLQAISFHHAELHEKGNQIFSSQAMSNNYLYTVPSLSPNQDGFQTPTTAKEQQWKQMLDENTKRMLQISWNKGLRHFSIPLNQYQVFPLTEIDLIQSEVFSGYSKKETERIIGSLWEGLYKNYFLGIKKEDGTIENPIGSTIPLILLAKDKTHLLVLLESAKGEPIFLRQRIANID
jgi:hypothetical protein